MCMGGVEVYLQFRNHWHEMEMSRQFHALVTLRLREYP
jgi:hypothetical protein